MKRTVVFYTNLNSRGFKIETEPEWIQERLKIWQHITLPSILNQTHKDFKYLVFHNKKTEDITKKAIEMCGDSRVIPSFKSNGIVENVDKLPDSDIFLLTRIDSDDAYISDYAERLHDIEIKSNYIQNKDGYGLHCETGRVFNVHMNGNGPFFSRVRGRDFLSNRDMNVTAHNYASGQNLYGKNFLVSMHGTNRSTFIGGQFGRKCVNDEIENVDGIMEKFNINKEIIGNVKKMNGLPDPKEKS